MDTIHSVQFSNHPGKCSLSICLLLYINLTLAGYKVFGTGPVLSAQDLINIIDGLRENDLLTYSHLLIGMYILHHTFSHAHLCRVYCRQVISWASALCSSRAEGEKQGLDVCVWSSLGGQWSIRMYCCQTTEIYMCIIVARKCYIIGQLYSHTAVY